MILTICMIAVNVVGTFILQHMAIAGLKHYLTLTENTDDATQAKRDVASLANISWLILLVILAANGIILYGVL